MPIILAILLVFLNKPSLGTSACPIYPMQKKIKNPGHLYLTLFTGLPVTLNTQLFFMSRMHVSFISCMYKKISLIYPMLEKKIGFSTDRHKQIPCPPPSFTNKIVGV